MKHFAMIIVHETFNCKPGNASKWAKKFKEAMGDKKEFVHVITDVTGQFNKIIVVTQYESLTAFDKSWDYYKEHPEEMKKMEEMMTGYTDMYLTGSREIFKVW